MHFIILGKNGDYWGLEGLVIPVHTKHISRETIALKCGFTSLNTKIYWPPSYHLHWMNRQRWVYAKGNPLSGQVVKIHSQEYFYLVVCVCSVTQLYLTLSGPIDCSPPVSSVHGIFQARILEWVVISYSIRLDRKTFKAKKGSAYQF